MKKWIVCLCAVLLLCCSCLPALANSWGIGGELMTAVSKDKTWNDYTAIGKQAGDAAVMHSRYHNALMLVDNGELHVYTTAVRQPDEADANRVKLTCKGDTLTLAYGEESFTFTRKEDGYMLTSAEAGDLTFTAAEDGSWYYHVTGGGETAVLQAYYPLSEFNIRLFPRTMDEVRRMNLLLAAADSSCRYWGWWGQYGERGRWIVPDVKGNQPVYSAPDATSWRAAKGKASVSLRGGVWVEKLVEGSDGRTYACIRYDVSERTQRIGYVDASVFHGGAGKADAGETIRIDVRAVKNTWLTDDPDVSQYRQIYVPEGTQLTCIGLYGFDYAYVTAEVKDGRCVDGGQIICGFVPLRDLAPQPASDRRDDVAAQLAGTWLFEAGGSMAGDRLELHADGTFDDDGRTGRWSVWAYNPFSALFWNDPPYAMALVYDNGCVSICGLTVEEGADAFSLTNWEGGGGYVRAE